MAPASTAASVRRASKSSSWTWYEHEQVMREGELELFFNGKTETVKQGHVVSLPPGAPHGYENKTHRKASFLCVVPATADYTTEWIEDSMD